MRTLKKNHAASNLAIVSTTVSEQPIPRTRQKINTASLTTPLGAQPPSSKSTANRTPSFASDIFFEYDVNTDILKNLHSNQVSATKKNVSGIGGTTVDIDPINNTVIWGVVTPASKIKRQTRVLGSTLKQVL